MEFLVDNQLPVALARYLQKRGFDCQHVLDVGLAETSDAGICQHAIIQERIIVSKDEDFFYVASQPGIQNQTSLGSPRQLPNLSFTRSVRTFLAHD